MMLVKKRWREKRETTKGKGKTKEERRKRKGINKKRMVGCLEREGERKREYKK